MRHWDGQNVLRFYLRMRVFRRKSPSYLHLKRMTKVPSGTFEMKKTLRFLSGPLLLFRGLFRLRLFLFFVVFIFILSAISYTLFFSSFFKVTDIEVVGTKIISPESVKNSVLEETYKKWAGFLPRNSSLIFPDDKILASLKNSFPRFLNVALVSDFPHKITVVVEERGVEGMWCGVAAQGAPERFCAFFDKNGVIFELAPGATRGYLLFVVEDMATRETASVLGDKVLNEETLTFLRFLRDGFALHKNIATVFRLTRDEELEVVFKGGWRGIFSRTDNPVYQVEVLNKVIQKEIKDNLPLLDYIDLRVQNKVFYAYR